MTDLIILAATFAAGCLLGSMGTALFVSRPPDPEPWSISDYYPTEYDEPPPRAVVHLTSRGITTEINP